MRPISCFLLATSLFVLTSASFGQVVGDYATEVTQLTALLDDWKTREDVPAEVRDMITQQGQLLLDLMNRKAPCLGADDALVGTYANVLAGFANKLSYPCTGVSTDAYQFGQQMSAVARSIAGTAEATALTEAAQDQPLIDSRVIDEARGNEQVCFVRLGAWTDDRALSSLTDTFPDLILSEDSSRPHFNKFTGFNALAYGYPSGGNFDFTVTLTGSSASPPPGLSEGNPSTMFDYDNERGSYQWLLGIGLKSPVKDGHYEIQVEVIYTHPDVSEPCHDLITLVLQDPPDK